MKYALFILVGTLMATAAHAQYIGGMGPGIGQGFQQGYNAGRAADPLVEFYRERGPDWSPQTLAEWCQVTLMAIASPAANEQLRISLREMARNRGCFEAPQPPAQAQPSFDEQVRIAVCRSVPGLLSMPNITAQQKLAVMKTAKDNGCIR